MDINNYIASGVIEIYVMGICSPEEKAEMELLRLKYPELNKAVLQFETAFENNLLKNATAPGSIADERILQSLKALQTPVININTHQTAVKKISWLRPVAAAAILLFAASSIFNYTLFKKTKEQELALNEIKKNNSLPETDYAILKNPAITPVAMYGVASHSICRCTMFWDKKTGKAYIMIHHLVPSSPERKYQLWAMVNDKPVNVGMLNDEIRGRFIEIQNVPEGATAFKVTLENAAGASTPTEEQTYLYGKI
ncbi:anti-sigma factor domain-containing protein [Ferruginibacter sp.]